MGANGAPDDQLADEPGTGPDSEETLLAAREAARTRRRDATSEILAAADARDVDADARDAAAVERENAFDQEDFVSEGGAYGDRWPERRAAGMDRAHSKDDRTASHEDRVALADEDTGTATPDH